VADMTDNVPLTQDQLHVLLDCVGVLGVQIGRGQQPWLDYGGEDPDDVKTTREGYRAVLDSIRTAAETALENFGLATPDGVRDGQPLDPGQT